MQDEALGPAAESLLSCYWVSDPTQAGNPLVFVSPAFEALSGFAVTEAIGKDANSLLQVSNKGRLLSIVQKHMQCDTLQAPLL